jgi:hypothetical protein
MIGRIALVAAVASEAFVFYTVAEWFAAGYREGFHHATPWYAMVAVALVAFFLPRLVEWADLRPRPAMTILAVAGYLTIYGLLRVQFAGDFRVWDLSWIADFVRDPGAALEGQSHLLVGTLLIICVWARCAYRASNDVELELLAKAVTIPFIVVTAIVVLGVYTERAGEVARAGAAYYAFAVLSLALAQLSLSGTSFGDLRAGGTVLTLISGIFAVTAGCVVVFWLVFGIVGPIIGPPIGNALFLALAGILWPIAWVLDTVLTFLLSGVGQDSNIELTDLSDLRAQIEEEEGGETTPAERGGIYATRILMLSVTLGGIALLILWLTHLRRRSRSKALDGEAVGITGALGEDLRGLFSSLIRRRHAEPGMPGSTAARRLYLEVLHEAEAEGLTRHPDETPNEIAPRMADAMHTHVTDEITAAFLQSRYAGREPDPRAVAELERRWRSARAPTSG